MEQLSHCLASPSSNLVGKVLHKWGIEKGGKMILISLNLLTQNYYTQLNRVAHRKLCLKKQDAALECLLSGSVLQQVGQKNYS